MQETLVAVSCSVTQIRRGTRERTVCSGVTVSVELPLIVLEAAVIDAVPAESPVARPAFTVAMLVFDDDHVAVEVTF